MCKISFPFTHFSCLNKIFFLRVTENGQQCRQVRRIPSLSFPPPCQEFFLFFIFFASRRKAKKSISITNYYFISFYKLHKKTTAFLAGLEPRPHLQSVIIIASRRSRLPAMPQHILNDLHLTN